MIDLDRAARLEEVKGWGVTDLAAQTGCEILKHLPEGVHCSIYPTGFDDDDSSRGDGGVNFQRFTGCGGGVVTIRADGTLDEAWAVDPKYREAEVATPAEAAAFLANLQVKERDS